MRTRRIFSITLLLVAGAALPARAQFRALDARSVLSSLGGRGLTIDLEGRGPATLRLHQVDLLAPGARFTFSDSSGHVHAVPRPSFSTLAGTVDADPGSDVRITVAGGWVAGTISSADETWSIEPDSWSAPSRAVVRPDASGGLDAASLSGDAVPARPAAVPQIGAGVANCAVFTCDRLHANVALDGDSYYRAIDARHPSSCFTRQIATFASIAAIYARPPLKIDLNVSHVNCHTTRDLGTSATRPLDYLGNLRAFWSGSMSSVDRSVVQLAVGFAFKPTDPAGLSYEGGACARIVLGGLESKIAQTCDYGYSIVQEVAGPRTNYNASAFLKAKLGAHEMGHSFNAEHDPSSMCPARGRHRGPIMCAFVQEAGPNRFSPESANAIRSWAEQNIGSATGT